MGVRDRQTDETFDQIVCQPGAVECRLLQRLRSRKIQYRYVDGKIDIPAKNQAVIDLTRTCWELRGTNSECLIKIYHSFNLLASAVPQWHSFDRFAPPTNHHIGIRSRHHKRVCGRPWLGMCCDG